MTDDVRIPIVLGVTGHRDPHPEAVEQLEAEVRSIFDELRGQYPNTPLVLLSPLAEGADRLAARVAVDAGVQLFVPLPWPEDACPELIHRSGDREEFHSLLAQATQTMPLPLVDGATGHELKEQQDCREKHWAQVGAYIARHSQILIALWDGNDRSSSSTAQTIRWQREGQPAPFARNLGLLDEVERGPVFHIKTPRTGTTAPFTVERNVLYPPSNHKNQQGQESEHFGAMWESLDLFNSDISVGTPAFADRLKKSRDWLLPKDRQEQLPSPLKPLFESFARADAAAMIYQDHSHRTLKWLFAVVACAGVSLEVYAHLAVDWWQLLALYIGLLFAAGLMHRSSQKQRYQGRHLDYRALAEALRVQFFWMVAELPDSVADHYLRHFRSELDWIRQAVRACVLVSGGHHLATTGAQLDVVDRFEWISTHWMEDQRKYFEATASQKYARDLLFETWGKWAFRLAVGFAIASLGTHLVTGHMSHPLIVAVFLMALIAAMLTEWSEKSGYVVDTHRYQWMAALFATAGQHLKALGKGSDSTTALELIKELGTEALSENAEWVIQHRHRPVSPPAAG